MGLLNDLWRFDLTRQKWQQLEADDGRAFPHHSAARPSGRVLPIWTAINNSF